MSKNITVLLLLVFLLAAGIGYTLYSAPERPDHELFELTLKSFASNSADIENQYLKNKTILPVKKTLNINFIDQNQVQTNVEVSMSVMNNLVTLKFAQTNSALANQSIVLEPYLENKESQQLRWKCLGGSVLVRFRTKDCRLGYGISTQALNQQ